MTLLPPVEPKLELEDIQGIAVPGFFKPHQTLLYLRVPKEVKLEKLRGFYGTLQVANGVETLADRRRARKTKQHENVVLTAIGFTYAGLLRFVPSAAVISSAAFKHGLPLRSALLGDPQGAADEGNPENWVVGGPADPLDAMIIVAGDSRQDVTTHAMQLAAELTEIGVLVGKEDGDVRADAPGHEHFGFDDGVSQPGIRGRASDDNNDFVTVRHLPPNDVPSTWLYGYPGQELIWPGEFVLGYPETSPDPLLPGPVATSGPAWMTNGSFLVYRRLRQDVVAFWQTMRDEAARLSGLPGFAGITDLRLASLLVGRWPSGAPVLRVPEADDSDLGASLLANNDFLFDSDTPDTTVTEVAGKYPVAKADPVGVTCPWAAHIRKVNTRDSASDIGGTSTTQSRRILRVGVAFGNSLPEQAKYGDSPDPEGGKRGLLFLSIQSSIEDQFEFLQSRWINDDSRPKNPGGRDMLVGQNAATPDGVRRCAVFGGLAQAQVSASRQFVIPTGGGYFFLPSLAALRQVIAGSASGAGS